MKRTIIIWGAGRIGRGFVADIFQSPDWNIVFVDIDEKLVNDLNARGAYTIHKATKDGIQVKEIKGGFTAIHTSDTRALKKLFLEKDLMLDVAVHAPKLPEVAAQLAPLFAHRAENAPHLPMDVMMNVNMQGPDERFVSLMQEALSGDALDWFNENVGVTGIFAMCISPIAPESILKKDPLALWNNGFYEQAIDRNRLKCPAPVLPDFPRLRITDNVEKEETRKLYTLNMAHAFICYLGLKMGLSTSCEAVNHAPLRKLLTEALLESCAGLSSEYGFPKDEMDEWKNTIIGLLENPYINDDLQRLGADTKRKLGAYDRLVGPARLSVKCGVPPKALSAGIRAGYDYENPDVGTQEVRAFVKAEGIEKAIQKYSCLTAGDGIYALVAGQDQ